jgi:ribonucleotide reductase beta subunit family protein with ferritin-like domain
VFGAFTEGLQLFASFAILMNFPRFNKMKGMGQIVTWSVRDESLHTESIIKLFRTFISTRTPKSGPKSSSGALCGLRDRGRPRRCVYRPGVRNGQP